MKLVLKTLIATLLCLLIPTLLFAGKKKASLTEGQKERLTLITTRIIKNSIPSLDNEINGRKRKYRLSFHTIKNPQYFLESNFSLGRFFFGIPKYKIGVNPLIFENNISEKALEGILVHELIHSEDYYTGSTIRSIIPIGLKVARKKSRIQYERKTDLRTIMLGYTEGLLAYKAFQYPLLNEKELTRKKREYLSPEEVKFITSIKDDAPELIKKWLKSKIPVNLDQFKSEYEEFKKKN